MAFPPYEPLRPAPFRPRPSIAPSTLDPTSVQGPIRGSVPRLSTSLVCLLNTSTRTRIREGQESGPPNTDDIRTTHAQIKSSNSNRNNQTRTIRLSYGCVLHFPTSMPSAHWSLRGPLTFQRVFHSVTLQGTLPLPQKPSANCMPNSHCHHDPLLLPSAGKEEKGREIFSWPSFAHDDDEGDDDVHDDQQQATNNTMEAPPLRYREPPELPAPAIYVDSSSSDRHYKLNQPDSYSLFSSSVARSIPGAIDPSDVPPPPLPPPRFFPIDAPSHAPDNDRHHHPPPFHVGPPSFSPSTHGAVGSIASFMDERPNYKRRESGGNAGKVEKDEGYASLSSVGSMRSEHSLPGFAVGFGHLHNRFQLESGADALTAMKKKLDPLKTLDFRPTPTRSLLSASANTPSSHRPPQDPRHPALSLPTDLPFHTKPSGSILVGSPDRFTQTPLYSATPSGNQPFAMSSSVDHRSGAHFEMERSPPRRTRRTNSDDRSTQGSYEPGEDMEMDDAPMNRLRIDDCTRTEVQTAGIKRRASSPPGRDQKPPGIAGQGELLRRRDVSRGSPAPRLSTIPQGSTPSIPPNRARSFNSGGLSVFTGLSSMNSSLSSSSYSRLSPSGVSPGGISPNATDAGCSSPYSAPVSLNPSPRGSLSRGTHQRNISENRPAVSPRKVTEGKFTGAKYQGFFMCECCPKKPKKFETAEDLSPGQKESGLYIDDRSSAHEAEKQYECSFCGNRFKNKNEAERHQNSLHVRPHSWSCSALTSHERAFHESTNRPGEADTCGYCGEEFPRSGRAVVPSAPRQVTSQNLEERARHLQEVHKFRECNSSKKFYRADHFRQHLKHSHSGMSGKWTNMLENACMMEEDANSR
ncbi:hypothetical protein SODALDRAFT_360624 [Sodiomyces alkalinus F11]|uniref:C2H2-type domain-containing protein n=1 Tax=Sodiomyces alkalinus (strain CBS 110278 / VKM F-3762 / F11) TaxID=1314773 RepID=A0A3N2PUU6_SODAK|nr:hypothetical protein SODALDRAFT_360624 [Sodiomyces alkalinus F11]ROT38272.1 hypothetical protein SODALDRAFT_360624 [Sodiomyces alkalinus F11]